MKNLILGLCTNYGLEDIRGFLQSWKNNAKSAQLILFAANLKPSLIAFAQAEEVELLDLDPQIMQEFHPLIARFFMFRSLLKQRPGAYSQVMLTDVRDVLFQSDPFSVPRKKPVTLALEHQTITSEPTYNGRWLRDLYGEELLKEIQHNPVSCAGTTLGTQEGMIQYLDLMCNEMLTRPFDRKINYDQGIHNYIAWKLKPEFIEVDANDEIFCTVGAISSDYIVIENNQISVSGSFPPVIHQWDRSKLLVKYTKQQLETPATSFVAFAPAQIFPKHSTSTQDDTKIFFHGILKPNRTLRSIIEFYLGFYGSINWGMQNALVEQIKKLIGPSAAALTRTDILGESGEFSKSFLQRFVPDLARSYFDIDTTQPESEVLRPEAANEWYDESFPSSLNLRLKSKRRPEFSLLNVSGFEVFALPYGCQLFNAARGTFLPVASSRAFPRKVQKFPHREIDSTLVIIQDQYDGGNFAHMLFDWLPRILHFALKYPDMSPRVMYLMGGCPGALHDLIIARLCEKYGLDRRQFIFPFDYEVIVPRQQIYFFSDQRRTLMHPILMGDPETVRLVRELFIDYLPAPGTGPEKIYISRGDAAMRRITNEDELVARLRGEGYEVIRLAELPLLEQIRLVGAARSIVAPHGMGLTHLIFNQMGGQVLELFNPTVGTDAYAFVARAAGLHYQWLLGEADTEGRADFSVDVNAVMACLTNGAKKKPSSAELLPVTPPDRLRIFEHLVRLGASHRLPKRLLVVKDNAPNNFIMIKAALMPTGFDTIKVEELPEEQAIQLFAGAEMVVALGREALTNVRYCAPGTCVAAVTAPGDEEGVEEYLASLDLRYINLVGDRVDGGWCVNPERLVATVLAYIS
jgi:capsular polysaccharide biosynthesis protein